MKQVLQNLHNGQTIVAEVPIPTPQAGEVLVHNCTSLVSAGTERMVVEFAGKNLLGKARSRPDLVRQVVDKARREGLLTTLEAAFNRLDQPMPLGYSSSGTINALGEGVRGFTIGQRVACAGGGYAVHAEYVCVPTNLLAPLPATVDCDSAAFTTLGAIALHGFRLAEVQLGERVVVIGLGLLGMLAANIARAAGCHVLGIDLDQKRVDLARKLGLHAFPRSQAVEAAQAFGNGHGSDAVLICADTHSPDPVELAGIVARDRARVIAIGAVGLALPRKIYYAKELTFLNSRSYGPGRYDPLYEEAGLDYPIGYVRWTEGRNLQAIVDLLENGRLNVKPLITHRFPIDQAHQAYQLITGESGEDFLGVLLTYPGTTKDISVIPQSSSLEAPESESTHSGHQVSNPLLALKTAETGITPIFPGQNTVRLGIVGAGNFATAVLLPALKSIQKGSRSKKSGQETSIELVGIASSSGASAQYACQKFGFAYASSEAAQIINDPQINTVAILTRHHLHTPLVLQAISAAKHVFCEKPLALNQDELTQIEQVVSAYSDSPESSSGVTPLLMVGFNRRFAPLARQMHQFLQDRQEAMVMYYRVNAGYIPLNHWVHDPIQGGGRIIGEACHFIDFLTYLVGSPPRSVAAYGLPDAGRYQEDNVVMQFTFPDGSIGTISYLANGDRSFPKERVEVFSSGRVAILDDFRRLELVKDGRHKAITSRLRQDKGHMAEWLAFAQSIQSASPPPIPYRQIFGVMEATFAANRALREHHEIQLTR